MDKIKSEHMSSRNSSPNHRSSLRGKSPSQQQKQRRSRTDNHNREFTCGCGKSYLSAAALYTHVKQKHEGVHQKGSLNPNISSRPSKPSKSRKSEKQDQKTTTTKQDESSTAESHFDAKSVYDDFVNFFSKHIEQSQNQKMENNDGYEWILDLFPRHFFKNSMDYYAILQSLEHLIKDVSINVEGRGENTNPPCIPGTGQIQDKSETQLSGKKKGEETLAEESSFENNGQGAKPSKGSDNTRICSDRSIEGADGYENQQEDRIVCDFYDLQRDIRVTSVLKIIGIFILNMSTRVDQTALIELLVFVTLLRKALNEKGWQLCPSPLPFSWKTPIETNLSINKEEKQMIDNNSIQAENSSPNEFCEMNCGERIGEIANVFICQCLPEYFSSILNNTHELRVIGPDEEGLKNACFLMQLFINWTFVYKFSDSRIIFSHCEENSDEEEEEQKDKRQDIQKEEDQNGDDENEVGQIREDDNEDSSSKNNLLQKIPPLLPINPFTNNNVTNHIESGEEALGKNDESALSARLNGGLEEFREDESKENKHSHNITRAQLNDFGNNGEYMMMANVIDKSNQPNNPNSSSYANAYFSNRFYGSTPNAGGDISSSFYNRRGNPTSSSHPYFNYTGNNQASLQDYFHNGKIPDSETPQNGFPLKKYDFNNALYNPQSPFIQGQHNQSYSHGFPFGNTPLYNGYYPYSPQIEARILQFQQQQHLFLQQQMMQRQNPKDPYTPLDFS